MSRWAKPCEYPVVPFGGGVRMVTRKGQCDDHSHGEDKDGKA